MYVGQGSWSQLFVAALVALAMGSGASLAETSGGTVKRARPPKWPKEVVDTFDVEIPESLFESRAIAEASRRTTSEKSVAPAATDVAGESQDASWAELIDADTVETEIKRLAQEVGENVATPTKFKGGGYEICRRDFSTLAMLFAVTADYGEQIRWLDAAARLSEMFARAARNCKVGTDATYREAAARGDELNELIRGTRPTAGVSESGKATWGDIDRAPLMQRLGIAHDERLTKWLANEREFRRHQDDLRHEAQLTAVVADVIAREGFEFWDDQQYAEYARALRTAASEMASAAEQDNYEQARAAIGRATAACNDCHEGYRG